MSENRGDKKPRIVVIGGGTGVFTVLSGLRKYPVDLTAVISMSDDGGSTGILREEFGILPPGDIRRAMVAMSDSNDRMLSDLFNYRFAEGGLRGHTFGNIMLTALERLTGSFETAVEEAARLLGVRGSVLPVTLDNIRLCAELENGKIIRGETNIDIPKHDGRIRIKKLWLELAEEPSFVAKLQNLERGGPAENEAYQSIRRVRAVGRRSRNSAIAAEYGVFRQAPNPGARINPRAAQALEEADMIVLGPGDLYSSIIPNLLVSGVSSAIKKSGAKKIYVVNLMTKWGETTGFAAKDFVGVVEKYLGGKFLDHVIVNSKQPSPDRLKHYEKESSEFVSTNNLSIRPTPIFGDFLRRRGFVRHDPERLAKVLVSLL